MNIVYDFQIFTAQQFGGISRYYCALAPRVDAMPDMTARIIAPLHQNAYLRTVSSGVRRGRFIPRWPHTGRAVTMLDAALFPALAARAKPDVVHETYFSPRATYPGAVPRVVTVLDMIHERFASQFAPDDPVAGWKRAAVLRADHVICISDYTRRDLLDAYALPDDKVSVVHLGYDRLDARAVTAESIVGPAPYLLFVGVRGGYKNFLGLARALASSPSLARDQRIVCLGGGAPTPAERAALGSLGLPGDAVQFVNGNDEVLAALYAGATALAYPSLYEGFGIPTLEAMAAGCPVVCSDASALPEVAGDAAEYFSASDPADLTRALESVVYDTARRNELVARGHLRAEMFSWDRCARETADIYRSLARGR